MNSLSTGTTCTDFSCRRQRSHVREADARDPPGKAGALLLPAIAAPDGSLPAPPPGCGALSQSPRADCTNTIAFIPNFPLHARHYGRSVPGNSGSAPGNWPAPPRCTATHVEELLRVYNSAQQYSSPTPGPCRHHHRRHTPPVALPSQPGRIGALAPGASRTGNPERPRRTQQPHPQDGTETRRRPHRAARGIRSQSSMLSTPVPAAFDAVLAVPTVTRHRTVRF